MTSDDRDNLLLYAAGALDADEADALRRRLDAGGGPTPEEAGVLAEAEAMLALLPLGLDEQSPSSGVKSRLMASVAASPADGLVNSGSPTAPTSRSSPMRIAPVADAGADVAEVGDRRASRMPMFMAMAASVLVFAVSLALVFSARQRVSEVERARLADVRELRAQLAVATNGLSQCATSLATANDTLEARSVELARANEMLSITRAAQLQMVGLAGPADAANAGPRGRIWWDKDQNQWLITVHDLKPPAEGREYELWFITADGKKLPSKTFNTSVAGSGMLMVDVPKDVPNITLAAITDEPLGGVSVPTGSIHLVGKLE